MTRDEHLAWAKKRALAYLDMEHDVQNAFASMASDLKKHGQEVTKLVPRLMKDPTKIPQVALSATEEEKALHHAIDFLSKEFSCSIVIESESASKNEKRKNAMPGKPAIVVE